MSPSPALVLIAAILTTACTSKPPLHSGIDLKGMDKSVLPGDDFNAYTNGGWIKSTPIPPDKSAYGNDAILVDETRKRTLSLIEDAAKFTVTLKFQVPATEQALPLHVVCVKAPLAWY